MLKGDTEPGFTIDLAHKDLTLIVEAANAAKVPVPIAAAAREAFSVRAQPRAWREGFLGDGRRAVRESQTSTSHGCTVESAAAPPQLPLLGLKLPD